MVKPRGKNQIAKFRRVAERLVDRILHFDGLAGIIFIGGLARGFADKYSDVDVIVFLSRKDDGLSRQIRIIGSEESRLSNIDVDLEVHSLAEFKKWKLDGVVMWDFSKAEIVFDSKGEVAKVFKRKFSVPESYWVHQIAVCAEHLKWYCCPPNKDVGTIAGSWIDRGDLASAHYCLNYALDLMLQMVYALNREFAPAPKWRVFYIDSLKWVPPDFSRHIHDFVVVKSLSIDDFRRRLGIINEIWRHIVPKIEQETHLTLDLLSKHFVETVLGQVSLPEESG